MNQFNQQLQSAKNKQRLLYIGLFALFIIGSLIILTLVMVSRGTRVEVKPDEAAISSSIQIQSGLAVIFNDTLYSLSNNPVLDVVAEGYKPTREILRDNNFGKVMTITLKPLPAIVEISTNIISISNLANTSNDTSWLINGAVFAVDDIFQYELEAGEYELTIDNLYFNVLTLPLSLERGETYTKKINLDVVNGEIMIKSNPSGAKVLINSIESGETPIILPILGGEHGVTLQHENYETINEIVKISRSNPKFTRNYRMQLKKSLVQISLMPNDGKLTLDGIAIKNTSKLSVEASVKHQLSYSKDGYFNQSKIFNIDADDSFQIDFHLEKEMGDVEINSSPEAEVQLNGQVVGATPLELSLNAVEQNITLTKKGYRSISKTIIPSSKSTKRVNVSLVPEGVARLKEAPASYTHKAGGKLKLYRPNELFTMGAKRSELGQRANEFIKKIKLTKAFYAGTHEVTNAEYIKYDNNHQGNSSEPVTSITWLDAAAFCNWLSQQEGLTLVYKVSNKRLQGVNKNADGYRLLTEAEWEWLARKSGKKKQSVFVWGDDRVIPKNAINIADESAQGKVKLYVSRYNDGYADVAAVGSLAKEPSGLYDQGGNVSEWTHDSYSIVIPESGKVFQDPFGNANAGLHVIKGANWRSGSITELRPSYREGLSAGRDDLGFRIGRYVYGGN